MVTCTITPLAPLDWDDDLPEVTIERAGSAYLAYESHLYGLRDFLHGSSFYGNADGGDQAGDGSGEGAGKKKKEYDLLTISDRKLKKLNYYQVLARKLPLHASTEEIRKAYHKACLKYHPDKTGRGEEDEVFLLVKKAFDTLSDPVKRRSYDSTVDFDESIPAEGVKAEDFYKEYGPVFERNLRFASFNDPARHAKADKPSPTKKKGKGKGKNKGGNKKKEWTSCPPFGDDGSSLDDVHAFYDFWTHFESWRDFTLAAEKETEHDLDSADCRDEKRWMKQEVDRKMKKLKREEMARINLLVERAMAADPRLRREKERKIREKKEKEDAKRRAEEEKAERERVEREKAEAQAAKAKAVEESKKKDAKKIKEQQKKQLRKAKQLFRKLTMAAYQSANPNDGSVSDSAVWDDLEGMNDDIELLCDKLDAMELTSLNDLLGGAEAVSEDRGPGDKVNVAALADVKQCAVETAAGAERQSLLKIQQRNANRQAADEKAREAKAARAAKPWTKEELAALAKAVKKYPAGGANRWESIALFINNLCKQQDPRGKEECIAQFNKVTSSPSPAAAPGGKEDDAGKSAEAGDEWTDAQDAALQDMLRKYPASMDKNERWSKIAEGVEGKSKKQCVGRFKAIREAVKGKK